MTSSQTIILSAPVLQRLADHARQGLPEGAVARPEVARQLVLEVFTTASPVNLLGTTDDSTSATIVHIDVRAAVQKAAAIAAVSLNLAADPSLRVGAVTFLAIVATLAARAPVGCRLPAAAADAFVILSEKEMSRDDLGDALGHDPGEAIQQLKDLRLVVESGHRLFLTKVATLRVPGAKIVVQA